MVVEGGVGRQAARLGIVYQHRRGECKEGDREKERERKGSGDRTESNKSRLRERRKDSRLFGLNKVGIGVSELSL